MGGDGPSSLAERRGEGREVPGVSRGLGTLWEERGEE